jgi:hypothetical protein
MTVTPPHDSDTTFTGDHRGLTRRQVTTAAAWAAPVIALAVATPLAAASDPVESPTAYVSGAINATGTSSTARTATYSGGSLNFDSAGISGVDSGNLTLVVSSTRAGWTTSTDIPAVYQAAGWTLVSASPDGTVFGFSHAPISNGQSVSMPGVTWSAPVGSAKPIIAISISSDSDDVSALGLTFS